MTPLSPARYQTGFRGVKPPPACEWAFVLWYDPAESMAGRGLYAMAGRPDIMIAGAVRTPLGKFGGALSSLCAPELGALAARAVLERSGVSAGDVEETIMGNARPAGVGPNPAR